MRPGLGGAVVSRRARAGGAMCLFLFSKYGFFMMVAGSQQPAVDGRHVCSRGGTEKLLMRRHSRLHPSVVTTEAHPPSSVPSPTLRPPRRRSSAAKGWDEAAAASGNSSGGAAA